MLKWTRLEPLRNAKKAWPSSEFSSLKVERASELQQRENPPVNGHFAGELVDNFRIKTIYSQYFTISVSSFGSMIFNDGEMFQWPGL